MAKNNKEKKWAFLLFIIMLQFVVISCDPNFETPIGSEMKKISIDSTTVLQQLDQGNTNVFTLIEAELEEESPVLKTVFWEQDEYFQVAQTLHQQLWQTPLESYVYYMSYTLDCADIDKGGFSFASFYSVQSVRVGKGKHRIEYFVSIFPSSDNISALRKEYGPTQERVTDPIDLESYEISAEEALRIAEENGAEEVRLEQKNECVITVNAPWEKEKGWIVVYSNFANNFYYKSYIDSQSGKMEKIVTNE